MKLTAFLGIAVFDKGVCEMNAPVILAHMHCSRDSIGTESLLVRFRVTGLGNLVILLCLRHEFFDSIVRHGNYCNNLATRVMPFFIF